MKHFTEIRRYAERLAKRHNLSIEQLSAFGDGTYRVEFKEHAEQSKRVTGFEMDEVRK